MKKILLILVLNAFNIPNTMSKIHTVTILVTVLTQKIYIILLLLLYILKLKASGE